MEEERTVAKVDNINGLSKVFYESGIFEDVKSEAQAMVKILAGREVGLSPIESMMNFYIVKNRLAPTAKVISALIKKSEKYDYQIETLTETECVLVFLCNGEDVGRSTFTTKDAAKAGLINKDNWKNYPRNMLFARALANGSRWFCPDVYCGYATEELEHIDITPEPATITLNDEGVNNGESKEV